MSLEGERRAAEPNAEVDRHPSTRYRAASRPIFFVELLSFIALLFVLLIWLLLSVLVFGIRCLVFLPRLALSLIRAWEKSIRNAGLCHRDKNRRKQALVKWLKRLPDTPDRTRIGQHYLGPLSQDLLISGEYPFLHPMFIPAEQKSRLRAVGHQLRLDMLREIREHSSHAEAKWTLVHCLEHALPFAIYLRGFAPEAYEKALGGQRALVPGVILFATGDRSQENEVYHATQKHFPIVAIANSVDFSSHGKIPKLEVPDDEDEWPLIVAILIEQATIIILTFESVSPGVLFELAVTKRHGKQHSTVVIGCKADLNALIEVDDFPHFVPDTKGLEELVNDLT